MERVNRQPLRLVALFAAILINHSVVEGQILGPFPRAFPVCSGERERAMIDMELDGSGKRIRNGDTVSTLAGGVEVKAQRADGDTPPASKNDAVAFETDMSGAGNLASDTEGIVLVINSDNNRQSLNDNPELSGSIPAWLGNMTSLSVLGLQNCNIKGELPGELSRLSLLSDFDLSNNPELVGSLPSAFAALSALTSLDLSRTAVSGTIPEYLCGLQQLRFTCSSTLCGCSCRC